MKLLVLLIFAITLISSVMTAINGFFLGGAALLFGTLLGFSAGAGSKTHFLQGNPMRGVIVGGIILAIAVALPNYANVIVNILSFEMTGGSWSILAAVLGFAAATPADTISRTAIEAEDIASEQNPLP
ncbi:hypothetical protein [Croceicoccus mobilis]|uniref:Uncharacterized protein n=1 Tax=Croceicoccus mobilis TaxID=1703339 RepID=A0A916YV08_9SPHN|nr:hypothetical protein [Croceicoccus mobilis]GGD61797.1 hypothetical protein GCM10010990_09080 [Croceicoccus mobilis]